MDELLPDVLHFPAGTDLHDHPLVQSAQIILQVALHLVCSFGTCANFLSPGMMS